ncbi:hypothetical protein BRW64_21880 [Mycolicibacterium diernhoferi]|nr:hypothetical protein BRW64_21880 [Mycolicibacterium diernhoferi]OPE56292.1 hypothetical protein BV510_00595 [Mycolicibacterium diernhoferi]
MALAPRKNVRAGRTVYWAGAAVTATSAYFVAQPQGWKSALGAVVFFGVAAAFIAYTYTPFLSIKGRVISFYSRSPQPYGAGVTANRSWWRLLAAMTVLTIGIIAYFFGEGGPWLAIAATLGIVISGSSFGYRDALLGAGFASGQRIQFFLTSAVTLGVFLIAYLAAYFLSPRRLAGREQYGRHAGPTGLG